MQRLLSTIGDSICYAFIPDEFNRHTRSIKRLEAIAKRIDDDRQSSLKNITERLISKYGTKRIQDARAAASKS